MSPGKPDAIEESLGHQSRWDCNNAMPVLAMDVMREDVREVIDERGRNKYKKERSLGPRLMLVIKKDIVVR